MQLREFGRDPLENAIDALDQRVPVTFGEVGSTETAVLEDQIAREEDARVPISQSEQLVEELETHNVRHEFRRYDGEPHGFGELDHVLDAYTRVADLFAKYLRRLPDDGSSRPYEPPE